MSGPEKIWSNPVLGTETYFDYDEAEKKIILETRSGDLDPLLEANTDAYNNAPTRFGDMTRVASIPPTMLLKLMQEGILELGLHNFSIKDQPRFRAWLNSSEFRKFRTRSGRL